MVAGYFIGYATAAHIAKLTFNVKQCQSYKERNETTFGILHLERLETRSKVLDQGPML